MASLNQNFINRLPDDVLWDIFMANALNTTLPTFSNGDFWFGPGKRWTRLDVARSTSQVCLRWRRIMLSSPSLWGRLLDSDDFGPDLRWMEDVVKRTGLENAPLWIASSNLYNVDWWFDESLRCRPISNIILGLLDSRWESIERLDLAMNICDEDLQDARWKNLFSLGTSVRHLSVNINRLPTCLSLGHPSSSFLSGPSMRNVRTLCLYNAAFSLTRVLYMLKEMPLLIALDLGRNQEEVGLTVAAPQLPPLETLYLPYLEAIALHNILGEAIVLLPRILAAPFCKLTLVSTCVPEFTCSEEDIPPFERALERFAQSYLSSPVPSGTHGKTLSFQIRTDILSFTMSTGLRKPEDEEQISKHDFRIEIEGFSDDEPDQLPSWLGDALTKAILSCRAPTREELFVLHVYELNPHYVDEDTPNLVPFILSFDIVESLASVTDKAIQKALHKAEASVRLGEIFPTVTKLPYEHEKNVSVQPEDNMPLLYEAIFLQDVSVRQSGLIYTHPKEVQGPHNMTGINATVDSQQVDDLISALLGMTTRGN